MTFQRNALLAGAIGLALAAGFAPLAAAAKDQDHKAQQHGKSDHGDKGDKSNHGDKGNKSDHGDKGNKSDHGDKHGNNDHGNASDHGGNDHADRNDHRDDHQRQASHVEHRDAPRYDDRRHEDDRAPQHRDDRDHDRHDAYQPSHGSPRSYDVRQDEVAHARNAQRAEDRRVSSIQRQQMIALQQRRDADYRHHLDAMRAAEANRIAAINAQRRAQQARYMDWYWQQQQAMAARWSPRDYNQDPYFNTAPSYRYYRDGRAYEVNQYAANALRDAVRNGYDVGVRAGNADRADGWRDDWRNNYAYQDANYGYNGAYVDQSDYNYYFRQGFQRGYQDAYGNNWQYGTRSNGNDAANILASVLQSILGLQNYN